MRGEPRASTDVPTRGAAMPARLRGAGRPSTIEPLRRHPQMKRPDRAYRRAAALVVPALLLLSLLGLAVAPDAVAQTPPPAPSGATASAAPAPAKHGGEASLIIPDLGQASFVGMN